MDELLSGVTDQVKKIVTDKKNKGTVIGAGIGYIVSKNNKERNAVIGGLVGYLLTKKSEDNE